MYRDNGRLLLARLVTIVLIYRFTRESSNSLHSPAVFEMDQRHIPVNKRRRQDFVRWMEPLTPLVQAFSQQM